MQRIANALNVSQRTISEDLRNLEVSSKSKPAKTASNPDGCKTSQGQDIEGVELDFLIVRPAVQATEIRSAVDAK
jgi:hypothetical protein